MSGSSQQVRRVASDKPFLFCLGVLGGGYLIIIAAMVLADLVFLDYADQPVLGPEIVEQGRYQEAGNDGALVTLEKARRYHFRMGRNELGLRLDGKILKQDGLFLSEVTEAFLV